MPEPSIQDDIHYPSIISKKISKTGLILQNSSNIYISEFEQQIKKNSLLYDNLLKNLIIDSFDKTSAHNTCKNFFNKDILNFAAIDGTEYAKQFFDMVLFYAGAYSCKGKIDFSQSNKIKTTYNEKCLNGGNEISSCVPIMINKIPEIDSSFNSSQNQYNSWIKQFSEQDILDNTTISNSLMTFAEFFLAYDLAASKQTDVIFLDRSISNVYTSLLYDTSKKELWKNMCSILGLQVDGELLDANDLTIARYNILNEDLDIPPSRGDYLRYSIIFNLHKNANLKTNDLCKLLKVNEEKTVKVQEFLDRWTDEKVLVKDGDRFRLNDKYKTTWTRINKIVRLIAAHIFQSQNEPFIITKNVNGKEVKEWLTTTDLAFLTLFSLYMLIEECWKNNILLIGITKDTVARDFTNHLLPIGIENSIWKISDELEAEKMEKEPETNNIQNHFANIIYSDRNLLQTTSLTNSDKINVPWSLIEYDSAFVMAIPDRERKEGYVSGAIKNKITINKLFLRSFVQLDKAKTNPLLRSNVLFIDRLVYPSLDFKQNENNQNIVKFMHEYTGKESIDFILYKDNKVKNPLQNLIITILKAMSCPSIAEAFGHNKALYIADKIAKWHNEEFRKIVDSTVILMSNKKNLRQFLFYMNTFRERRQEYESNRRIY